MHARASPVRVRELRFARGAHFGEIVSGVIARTGQRAGRDLQKPLGPRDRAIGRKLLGRDEFFDLRVLRRRL